MNTTYVYMKGSPSGCTHLYCVCVCKGEQVLALILHAWVCETKGRPSVCTINTIYVWEGETERLHSLI